MAHTVTHAGTNLVDSCAAAVAHLTEVFATKLAHHRIMKTTLKELRSLSMSELADLGLNPSMLRSIAKEAADEQVTL